MTDYYKVLGLDRKASPPDAKLAFRKLALKFHPDRHATSPEHQQAAVNQRFKELLEAYEVLSDEKKRRSYNQTGRQGFSHGSGGGGGGTTAEGFSAAGNYSQGPFQGYYWQQPSGRWRSPPNTTWSFHFNFARVGYVFHGIILTSAFVAILLAGSAAEAVWKSQISGKSFEDAMEAVELRKQTVQKREFQSENKI